MNRPGTVNQPSAHYGIIPPEPGDCSGLAMIFSCYAFH
nr:MAG TPA: hypothetical protein [Caudoviricetes sp.]